MVVFTQTAAKLILLLCSGNKNSRVNRITKHNLYDGLISRDLTNCSDGGIV